jgi:hypothetical protein
MFAKNIHKSCVTISILVALLFGMLTAPSANAINKTSCKLPAKTKIVDGVKFKCVADGEKLIWAKKKLIKKIAKKLKKKVEEKKKSENEIKEAAETNIEPPKNPNPRETTYIASRIDRSDFASMRNEGFNSIRDLKADYLRYQEIYKSQNEKLLQDYERALSDVNSSGWMEYDLWYAEVELQLSGKAYEEYVAKAKKRVESDLRDGIKSIKETDQYYQNLPQLIDEYIKYFKSYDPSFTDEILNSAIAEAERIFTEELNTYREQAIEQERQYQSWVAENLKYQQVDISRFNRIYKDQYQKVIENLQDALKDIDSAGYIEDAKWIAEFELGLKGTEYEEFIERAISEAEQRIKRDIEEYKQTLQYYEDSQRELEANVAYLSDSSYEFSDQFLEDALREAVVLAEREYQTYLADQIRWQRSDLLSFQSLYEADYRNQVERYQQEIENIDNSEDFAYERYRAEELLGLSGEALENYLSEKRQEYIANIEDQMRYYQETLEQYEQTEQFLEEQIEYLNENEYEFTDQLLDDALNASDEEAARREEEERIRREEEEAQIYDEESNSEAPIEESSSEEAPSEEIPSEEIPVDQEIAETVSENSEEN